MRADVFIKISFLKRILESDPASLLLNPVKFSVKVIRKYNFLTKMVKLIQSHSMVTNVC